MYPFFERIDNKLFVKLHAHLYDREIIDKIAKEEPKTIASIRNKGDYYFLELSVDEAGDYLNFLNYLLYLSRAE